jgi:hypothetical protein
MKGISGAEVEVKEYWEKEQFLAARDRRAQAPGVLGALVARRKTTHTARRTIVQIVNLILNLSPKLFL